MDPRPTASGTAFRRRLGRSDRFPRYHPLSLSLIALLSVLMLSLSACSGLDQIIPTGRSNNLALQEGHLEKHGLALITPSTVTGQEEDRQALAMSFTSILNNRRPDIAVSTLSEALGAINRHGLAKEYQTMFEDYRYTGIFNRDTLKKIGEVTDRRYLAQLKLSNFNQSSDSRLSLFGLRLIKTKEGNIRLFMTVWDSWDGSIAWEGMQELNYAYETFREKPITFKQAVDEASKELIKQLP